MTRMYLERITCFICHDTNDYPVIRSTSQFGHPDLDTRPSEMARSTIVYRIMCCPSCGYCAPDVSKGQPHFNEVVGSEAYVEQRDSAAYPELTNRFLCWVLLQESVGNHAEASRAALQAAWICDDAEEAEASVRCRERAIALLQRARAEGVGFAEEVGVEEAVLADLFRRSRQFEEVEGVCEEGLAKNPGDVVRKVLSFQSALARREDVGWYTVADAERFAAASPC